jgi:hypothetical protein
VLCFHDIRDNLRASFETLPDGFAVDTKMLTNMFSWIQANGYHPVTLAQIDAARDAWYGGFVAEAIDGFFRTNAVLDTSGRRHKGVLTGDDMAKWRAGIEARTYASVWIQTRFSTIAAQTTSVGAHVGVYHTRGLWLSSIFWAFFVNFNKNRNFNKILFLLKILILLKIGFFLKIRYFRILAFSDFRAKYIYFAKRQACLATKYRFWLFRRVSISAWQKK